MGTRKRKDSFPLFEYESLTGTRFSFVSGLRIYFRRESAPTHNSKRAILQRGFSNPHLNEDVYIEKRSDYD
jgi:hypothetical protein